MTDYQFEELKRHSQLWGENIKIITIATKDSFKDFIQLFERSIWYLLFNRTDGVHMDGVTGL